LIVLFIVYFLAEASKISRQKFDRVSIRPRVTEWTMGSGYLASHLASCRLDTRPYRRVVVAVCHQHHIKAGGMPSGFGARGREPTFAHLRR